MEFIHRINKTPSLLRGSFVIYDWSYSTYCSTDLFSANTALCLIHQANFLLDQQLKALEEQFLTQGGFTERLCKLRSNVSERF